MLRLLEGFMGGVTNGDAINTNYNDIDVNIDVAASTATTTTTTNTNTNTTTNATTRMVADDQNYYLLSQRYLLYIPNKLYTQNS